MDWLVPKKKKLFEANHGFRFKNGHIYRILAKKYIPQPDDKFQCYYVKKILEKDVAEPRLFTANQMVSQLKKKKTEKYLMPVVINDTLGEFTLNRDYNCFEGHEWLEKGGSLAGYLFRCRYCGKYRFNVDCD